MGGLTDHAGGVAASSLAGTEEAQRRWQAAMLDQIERLRVDLRRVDPALVAGRVGGVWNDRAIILDYWGRQASIPWGTLSPVGPSGEALSAFDTAMLLHHLRWTDGSPPSARWIGFRELPGGEFYHQAYLGYTGRRLADTFGTRADEFDSASVSISGERLPGPAPHAWRFAPLLRVLLAACLWPGDDELPAQASVLFDAHAGHHLPLDGLALLGAGLTGRLLGAAQQQLAGTSREVADSS